MEVISTAWRSDLAILDLEGVAVEHHPTYVVARPTASQGLLLLRKAPLRRDVARIVEVIDQTFPDARRVVVGVDDPEGSPSDLSALEDIGFTIIASRALTVEASTLSPLAPARFDVRPLQTDEDWSARAHLLMSLRSGNELPHDQLELERRLAATGRAAWWGGFEGLRLVGSAGIVLALPHLARCQGVDVDRDARGTGLAEALVVASVLQAQQSLGAETAMVLADRGHAAVGLYEDLGFRASESLVRAARAPSRTSPISTS